MNKVSGNISKALVAVISVAAVISLIIVTIAASYISAHNYGVRAERTIEAEYENMENILAQYSVKIKEAAQVPTMQKDDLLEVFTGAIESRYGEDGSKAAFQWIQEQNPNLDQGTYKKLMQLIEGGRNKFENAQTKFIDTKRAYETNLGYFWKGFWMKIAGYPKIDMDEYTIVSSTHAKKTFESGIDEGLNLR